MQDEVPPTVSHSSAAAQCRTPQLAAALVTASYAAAAISLRIFAAELLRLTSILSPGQPIAQTEHISWAMVWLGVLVEQALIPAALLAMWLNPEIEWGGIRYRKRRGRVRVVSSRSQCK
jgi:hypothetical protein